MDRLLSRTHPDANPNATRALLRCPHEIWRSIFNSVVEAVCSENTYLRLHPPINGHDIMLQEAGVIRDTTMEPIVPVNYSSCWCLALRVRKQLILVCRAWWAAGVADIYANVYLHRVGQLPALVRTLDEAKARESSSYKHTARDGVEALSASETGNFGYGPWISHITIDFHLPHSWLDVHRDGLDRLITLCPNLQSLIHRPIHSLPLLVEPLSTFVDYLFTLDTSGIPAHVASNDYEKTVGAMIERPLKALTCLKHLTVGEPILIPNGVGPRLLDVLQNLTSLELTLPRTTDLETQPLLETKSMQGTTVTFPHLHTFAITINLGKWSRLQLSYITDNWLMPKLVRFFVLTGDSFDVARHRPLDIIPFRDSPPTHLQLQNLKSICSVHGNNLQHLFLEDAICFSFDLSTFTAILGLCPQLRNFAFPCSMQTSNELSTKLSSASSRSYTFLETVTIFLASFPILAEEHNGLDPCTPIILELRTRRRFPALKVVRASSQDIDDLYGCSPESDRRSNGPPNVDLSKCRLSTTGCHLVLLWAHMLASAGVTLQNYSHRTISPLISSVITDQMGWDDVLRALEEIGDGNENEGDTSDDSYKYESASQTTSYEDSDIGSDCALEHEIVGEECVRCQQQIDSTEHCMTMWWLEGRRNQPQEQPEAEAGVASGSQQEWNEIAAEWVSRDGGQIEWNEALERFEESLRREREYESSEADDDDDEP